MTAPYKPDIKNELDVSNFDKYEIEDPWSDCTLDLKKNRKQDNNFIGYTFKKDSLNERKILVKALEKLEVSK